MAGNSCCNNRTIFRCWSRRSAGLTRQIPARDCLTNSLHGASTLWSSRICSLFACSLFIEDMAKMRFTVVSQRCFLTTPAINSSFCRVHLRGAWKLHTFFLQWCYTEIFTELQSGKPLKARICYLTRILTFVSWVNYFGLIILFLNKN
jgi:hypothetical protein